jgi:chromosome segregation ATPase
MSEDKQREYEAEVEKLQGALRLTAAEARQLQAEVESLAGDGRVTEAMIDAQRHELAVAHATLKRVLDERDALKTVLEAAKHALVVDGIAARRDPHDSRVHVAGKLLMLINDALRHQARGGK